VAKGFRLGVRPPKPKKIGGVTPPSYTNTIVFKIGTDIALVKFFKRNQKKLGAKVLISELGPPENQIWTP